MYSVYDSRLNFPRVVDNTLCEAGVDYDAASTVDISRNSILGSAVKSTDGSVDIFVQEHLRGWGHPLEKLHTPERDEPYTLRELLIHRIGLFSVSVESSNTIPHWHSVMVNLVPSPLGINNIQSSLGRSPGSDAFEVFRVPGKGYINGGDLIPAHANLRHIVADVTTPYLATHDMDPFDHLQSIYASGPQLCKVLQQSAEGLLEILGNRVYDPDNAPSEVGSYVSGFDDLQIYTRSLVWLVHDLSQHMEQTAAVHVANLEQIATDKDLVTFARLFQELGIISRTSTKSEIATTIRSITASTLGNLADMYERLEEVQPIPELTLKQRSYRQSVWRSISENLVQLESPLQSAHLAS